MKRIICLVISLVIVFSTIPIGLSAIAETNKVCSQIDINNNGAQDYYVWSSVVKSYASNLANGNLMLVLCDGDNVYAEYYDANYCLTSVKKIPEELPIFGAFYETEEYYFILTGQTNPTESSSVEVCRLTKYDKTWKRLDSIGFYDINTVIPFDAGSARMAHNNDYLVIRTSHEMYKSEDGKNHQANMTFYVDYKTMKIVDYCTRVANVEWMGYVSHSFNQFVKIEDDKIVAVDHGDAFPRSVVLVKYKNELSSNYGITSMYNGCEAIDVLDIYGNIGENYTGVCVGGFEVSPSSYLIAGTSVIQDENYYYRETSNVFLGAVDKGTNAVKLNWITDYKEGDGTTSTPHLVKINDNRFLLIWARDSKVYYCELDKNGNKTSEIFTLDGYLSDCAPIIRNSKVFWYAYNNGIVDFYEIDTNNIKSSKKQQVDNRHDYKTTKSEDGTKADFDCKKCGNHYTIEEVKVLWRTSEETEYTENFKGTYPEGTILYYKYQCSDSNERYKGGISKSYDSPFKSYYNYDRAECDGAFIVKGHGEGEVVFSTNEYVSRKFKINVPHNYVKNFEKKATCTEKGYVEYKCSCREYKYEYIEKKAHSYKWVTTKKASYFNVGEQKYMCSYCSNVINTKRVAKTKLNVPSFKLVKGKKQFKVKYTSVGGANGFQIRYRIKGKWKTKLFYTTKSTTKAVKNLKKGKYSVQIRAFVVQNTKKAYSSWASIKKVKVK